MAREVTVQVAAEHWKSAIGQALVDCEGFQVAVTSGDSWVFVAGEPKEVGMLLLGLHLSDGQGEWPTGPEEADEEPSDEEE